jgi:riboflavin kinase, archaea type
MAKPRAKSSAERLTTLMHLVRLGAGASFAGVSTKKLGASMGLSQQAASLRLIELERFGLIERARSGRGLAVRLTGEGLEAVETFLSEASTNLERGKNEFDFRGTLFTGFGEGGYYISLKGYSKAFYKALGFEPYPGTLNLRLTAQAMIEERRRLELLKGIEVPGFKDGKRTYGPVKCFKARIEGRHPGAVLAIERTHYDTSVLEIISPLNLRKALGLKDGDECSVTAYLS